MRRVTPGRCHTGPVSDDGRPPTVELVEELLAVQHPDLADRPVAAVGGGWDNLLFRVGDDLAARLPRRKEAAHLVAFEQRWLPALEDTLPLPVPAPRRVGRPGCGYPWSWSVVPWFDGDSAMTTPPADPVAAAVALGGFFGALHRPAPPDAPPNPYRGVPLVDRDVVTRQRLAELARSGTLADDDVAALTAVWSTASAAPRWTRPSLWLHGDPHSANIVVDDGEVVAVVDFGDICSGDPASDLIVAHYLLPRDCHGTFRAAHGAIDDDTWARSLGWVVCHTAALLGGPSDAPLRAAAHRAVRQLLDHT